MTFRSADIQDAANQVFENLKSYLKPAAKEAYATGYKRTKQLRQAYPAFADSVSDAAYRTIKQSKQALKTAGNQVAHSAGSVGRQVHCLETSLIKVGFIYMIYRLFISDDHVAKATHKVKARINEKPVESALIALGVGYVIGKIVRW